MAENIDYGLVAFGPNNRHNNSRRVDHPNAGSLHPEERHTTQAADGEGTMQFCRADRRGDGNGTKLLVRAEHAALAKPDGAEG